MTVDACSRCCLSFQVHSSHVCVTCMRQAYSTIQPCCHTLYSLFIFKFYTQVFVLFICRPVSVLLSKCLLSAMSYKTLIQSKKMQPKSLAVYFKAMMCEPQSNLILQAHRWFQAEYSPLMASWPFYLKRSREKGLEGVDTGKGFAVGVLLEPEGLWSFPTGIGWISSDSPAAPVQYVIPSWKMLHRVLVWVKMKVPFISADC